MHLKKARLFLLFLIRTPLHNIILHKVHAKRFRPTKSKFENPQPTANCSLPFRNGGNRTEQIRWRSPRLRRPPLFIYPYLDASRWKAGSARIH